MKFPVTPETRAFYLARARKHRDADEIIQRSYWDGTRGCAVGCLAETANALHRALHDAGILPEHLAHLADAIHEGLPLAEAKAWPVALIEAIPESGADLGLVWSRFAVAMLADPESPVVRAANGVAAAAAAVAGVASLYRRRLDGTEPDDAEWAGATSAAGAAWATSAAWAASTARAAGAAWAAAGAAWAAAGAARAAGAVGAVGAAGDAAYRWMRDALLRIVRETHAQGGGACATDRAAGKEGA